MAPRFATLRREGYQQPRSVGVRSGSPEVLFPPVIGNERNGILMCKPMSIRSLIKNK
jgi:hypothetical protein